MATPVLRAQMWFRDFWAFYRRYVKTASHTAATAALAIFGILVFVDPWFAAVAIACYVIPPVVLYVLADDPVHEIESDSSAPGARDRSAESRATEPGPRRSSDRRGSRNRDTDSGNGDTDSDSDDGDTDSDSDDGDTDSDG
ncbi:hypothetical protein ACLI4Z_14985 [Natrialbaceae archaeon A-arb3/5]